MYPSYSLASPIAPMPSFAPNYPFPFFHASGFNPMGYHSMVATDVSTLGMPPFPEPAPVPGSNARPAQVLAQGSLPASFITPPSGAPVGAEASDAERSSVSESTTIEILASRQEAMQTELEGMKRKLDNMTSEVQGAVGKLNRIVPAMISVIGRPDGGAAGKTRSRRGLVTSRSPEKATPKGKERARSDGEGCVDDH